MSPAVRAQRPIPAPSTSYLPEVQGLRTVAVVLVAIFHIWIGRVSGGVDVFLLISAYLLTRSLTASATAGNAPRPLQFILRKFARLLPLAAATILLTLVAGWLIMPASQHATLTGDALASLGYFENIRLQQLQADYYAHDLGGASLFQHFWSLSIQGQVFIIWPLLHLLGFAIAHRSNRPLPQVLGLIFGIVFIASFAWSVWHTIDNQPHAYFDTFARMWEFALGSLVALVAHRLQLSAGMRNLMSWLGLLGVVLCGIVLPVESSFPGFAALWPTLSAVLIIVAAEARNDEPPARFSAERLLATGPLRWLGQYTYALYLVHWPLLLLAVQLTKNTEPNFMFGTGVLAVAFGFSFVLTELIEKPVSRVGKPRKPARHLAVIAIAAIVVAAPALIHTQQRLANNASSQAQLENEFATATSTPTPAETEDAYDGPDFTPLDVQVGAQNPDAPANPSPVPDDPDAAQTYAGEGTDCTDHAPNPGDDAICWELASENSKAPTAFFVGNSHTQQLAPVGYQTAAITGYLNVRVQAGPSCTFTWQPGLQAADVCDRVWLDASDYIADKHPELVVVLGTKSAPDGTEETWEHFPTWLKQMRNTSPDTKFVVVRDNPRFEVSPYECALVNGFDSPDCQHPANKPVSKTYIKQIEDAGALWVDFTDYYCPDATCRPEVGGVVTWFDAGHITTAFSRTLTQRFADEIHDHVPWWPDQVFAE